MSTDRVCDNCEEAKVSTWCVDCKQEFCDTCDAAFHEPIKMRRHVRKPRFAATITDILIKAEKEGKVSDYGASKPEGKSCRKFVLETEDGYYYLFKNEDNSNIQLELELSFNLTNLVIEGYEEANKLKICLPPASMQYIHLKRVDVKAACSCDLTQRFALIPPKPGKVGSISIPVIFTGDTPREVLRAQTEKDGICTDHGSQDPSGSDILQFQWEYSGGYCFLWINASKDVLFHKELELEMKNLAIVGKEPDEKKYVIDLKPGQEEFMMLREITPQQAYGVSMRAGFSLQKIKS